MKNFMYSAALILASLASPLLQAQAPPATKPADATGLCKDGSYSTAASKSGACQGHHGVKEWYTAVVVPAPQPSPAQGTTDVQNAPASVPNTPTAAPSPTTQVRTQSAAAAANAGQSNSDAPLETQSIKKGPSSTSATAIAPGGGPGMVWVNTKSKAYHCSGTKYYGKTKAGSYMTEADAKAAGNHGKPCTK